MATRLKPSRINVDNTPRVGDGAAYQNDNDFHWSMGGGDMSYRDFEWHTLTGNSITIEDISNNITPSSDFTVTAGTELKPGIEYVLRVNTGNTPYEMTLGTGVTNPNGYSTELTPNKVNQFKFIATSNSQLELEGVDTSEYLTGLTILSYGTSTWNDFITAYNKNAIVYCRASSNSNPATGSQTRLAFMAYVNNADTPTEVEFQYYRSRSSHGSDANQQDEVYVYKLTNASGGTWTVEVRDTAAKIATGTGLTKAYTTSGSKSTLTIANDGVLTVNGSNGTVTVNDIKQSATAPSSPTEGMVWYDTTNDQLKVYDGTNWNVTGKEYNAGEGIDITNNEISLNAEFMTQSAYDNITPESGKYYLIYEHRYPDISISVSSNYEGQTPGKDDEVQFTVRVTNDGDSTITINIESQLTEDYYSDTFNQGQTREYELSWYVTDTNIKAGNFVFDVTASEENNPENTITYTKTIMTEPIQYPTLSIQITPSQQSAGLGEKVDFDISVTNNLYYIDEVDIASIYSERNYTMAGGQTVNLQDSRKITQADVTQGSFTFTVTAQENGNPQNIATASVTISVTS